MFRSALLARHVFALPMTPSLRLVHTAACVSPVAASHDIQKLTAALDSTNSLSRTRALLRLRRVLLESARSPLSSSIPTSLIQRLADEYDALSDQKSKFATVLSIATELGEIDWPVATKRAASFANLQQPSCDADFVNRLSSSESLRTSCTPPYVQLFHLIANFHKNGVAFLVRFRRDLLSALSSYSIESLRPQDYARLRSMNDCLRQILAVLFCVSNLQLRRISWSSLSPSLRDFLVRTEAVHPVNGSTDLQRRLGCGRRVFAFFHSAMPDDRPLVFVNVALTESISDNVQSVLNIDPKPDCEQRASCAIFYSITSAEPGLAGVELGNHLIKAVVKQLKHDLPHVTTFSTLSPIPGFKKWMDSQLVTSTNLLTTLERQALKSVGYSGNDSAERFLHHFLSDALSLQHALADDVIRPIVMRLCARYVVVEKRKLAVLDPVTNFHVRNGATVFRLNWRGDTSSKGYTQSVGMMANYLYQLDRIETNHQQYVEHGRVDMSPDVAKLVPM